MRYWITRIKFDPQNWWRFVKPSRMIVVLEPPRRYWLFWTIHYKPRPDEEGRQG